MNFVIWFGSAVLSIKVASNWCFHLFFSRREHDNEVISIIKFRNALLRGSSSKQSQQVLVDPNSFENPGFAQEEDVSICCLLLSCLYLHMKENNPNIYSNQRTFFFSLLTLYNRHVFKPINKSVPLMGAIWVVGYWQENQSPVSI